MATNQEPGGVTVRTPIQKRNNSLQCIRILLCELQFQRDRVAFLLLNDFRRVFSQAWSYQQREGQRKKH